jgi:hypothetical protein
MDAHDRLPTIQPGQEFAVKRINEQQKLELCKLLAWFWKSPEIIKYFEDEHQLKLKPSDIKNYRAAEKWKPIIEKFRDDYLKDLNSVPLANKRKRLDELEKLYDSAIADGDLDQARILIREFREEVEKKVGDVSVSFTQINHNEYHEMTDEDLQAEKVKTLEQLEKVRKLKQMARTINLGDVNGLLEEEDKSK